VDKLGKNHLEELEHTADVALKVRAKTLPGLFLWAARGLVRLLFEGPLPPPEGRAQVSLAAPDAETLLVRFLNELIYLVQTKGLVPVGMRLRLSDCQLEAELFVVPFERVAERFLGEIKSATFHGLKIEVGKEGYVAQVVFDV